MDSAVAAAEPKSLESSRLQVRTDLGSLALQNWRSEDSGRELYLNYQNGLPKAAQMETNAESADRAASPTTPSSSSRSSRAQSEVEEVFQPPAASAGDGASGLCRLVKLARLAVRHECTEWKPDEEEKAIIARAVKRLRERISGAIEPERQQLQRVSGELKRRSALKKQTQPAQPASSRPSLAEVNRAEYQLNHEDPEPPSPLAGRRKGILRTTSRTSFTPQITVSEAAQLPIASTTALQVFQGYTFPRPSEEGTGTGDSPDQTPKTNPSNAPSPAATPKSALSQPRLPLKPRGSTVSIAETEELLEFESSQPPRHLSHSLAQSVVSESTASGGVSGRSSNASAKTSRSPRHSLANVFRFKDSQIPMGESKRSDLELGWALSQALQEAAKSGQLRELAGRRKTTPTTQATSGPSSPEASSPTCIKLDLEPSLPDAPFQERVGNSPEQPHFEGPSAVPGEDVVQQQMSTFREEIVQRNEAWVAGLRQTLQEERDKEMSQVQECIRVGLLEGQQLLEKRLAMLDERMDARLGELEEELSQLRGSSLAQGQGLQQEKLGDISKQQHVLNGSVSSLQCQVERMEETQADLLQQMEQAKVGFTGSLERQLAAHQEAVEERCQELQRQLRAERTEDLGRNRAAKDAESWTRAVENLQCRMAALEEKPSMVDQSETRSNTSMEDLVGHCDAWGDELGRSLADLEQRMVVDFKAVRDEILEQTKVVRAHYDHQVDELKDSMEQQQEACEDLRRQIEEEKETRATESQDLLDEISAAQKRMEAEAATSRGEALAALEEKYDRRMSSFEDSMETRRRAQQREVERMHSELHRSVEKLEGSQKILNDLLAETLPKMESFMTEALEKERLEHQDRFEKAAQAWDKQAQDAASVAESRMKKLEKGLASFNAKETQLREFTSSECDTVLQAMKGRICQEAEERVLSIATLRRDITELKGALGDRPSRADETLDTGCKTPPAPTITHKSPAAAEHWASPSPARTARSPFAGGGMSGSLQAYDAAARKDLCRRKCAGTTRARTPR